MLRVCPQSSVTEQLHNWSHCLSNLQNAWPSAVGTADSSCIALNIAEMELYSSDSDEQLSSGLYVITSEEKFVYIPRRHHKTLKVR
jgi:hypothetical protein